MIEKKFTYTDFNDVEQTETFYFHLSKSELAEMELSVDGGMAEWLKQMANSGKASEMLDVVKKMVLSSVGEKSLDGKRFVKNKDIANDFLASPAFDQLFMEVATDAEKAAAFIKGIVPPEFSEKFDSAAAEEVPTVALDVAPAPSPAQ